MPEDNAKAGPGSGPAFAAAGPPGDTQLWLVRHGETQWSRSGRHTGRTDLELTAHGRDQSRALRGMLSHVHPVLVLSSPLRRARQTAELAGLRAAEVAADLAEWDYGDYEGRTCDEIRTQRPGWTLFGDGVPHGERIEQVGARADRVLARAAAALRTGPVVLVGHGHINRVLAARWLGLPAARGDLFALGVAAPCLLGREHGRAVLTCWNLPNPAVEGTNA